MQLELLEQIKHYSMMISGLQSDLLRRYHQLLDISYQRIVILGNYPLFIIVGY